MRFWIFFFVCPRLALAPVPARRSLTRARTIFLCQSGTTSCACAPWVSELHSNSIACIRSGSGKLMSLAVCMVVALWGQSVMYRNHSARVKKVMSVAKLPRRSLRPHYDQAKNKDMVSLPDAALQPVLAPAPVTAELPDEPDVSGLEYPNT